MRLQNVPRFLPRLLINILRTVRLPIRSCPPVDEFGMRLGAVHVFICVIVAHVFTKGTYLMNDIQGQRFIIDRDSLKHELDHPRKFIVHHQLPVVHDDACFKHPQAVYQVGTCQRRQYARQRLFISGLGIGNLVIRLPAGDTARQQIVTRHFSNRCIQQGCFRRTHRRRSIAQIHTAG